MTPQSQPPACSTSAILGFLGAWLFIVIILFISICFYDEIWTCLKKWWKRIDRHGQRLPMQNVELTPTARNQAKPPLGRSVTIQSPNTNMVTEFTYEELVQVTEGFSNSTFLGKGQLGYVHKGDLPNGNEIVVKKFRTGRGRSGRDFQAEVDIVSSIPYHEHLVSLVGYCNWRSRRLLVYEFVPNNTLEFHLHGEGRPTMDWPTRMKIALGVAKGLAYLHEDCHPNIVHGDIKASNILLDHNFNAKVTDFGFVKFVIDKIDYSRIIAIRPFGYIAPEYMSSGKLTYKSDVFSFGVILLELITGKQPVDTCFVDSARQLIEQFLEEGIYEHLVDPHLKMNFNANEMKRMVETAFACLRYNAYNRADMSQVVAALEFRAHRYLT